MAAPFPLRGLAGIATILLAAVLAPGSSASGQDIPIDPADVIGPYVPLNPPEKETADETRHDASQETADVVSRHD